MYAWLLVAVSLQYLNFLSWERRLKMLHDVACGVLYLHSRCYVHGDLRSPNLYVTESGRVSERTHTLFMCDTPWESRLGCPWCTAKCIVM